MDEIRILIAIVVACAVVVFGLLIFSHGTTTKIVPGVPATKLEPK
jgi:hypothetical protein